ncbi:MAG: response regulator [Planctomycetes bacterium]|nr:response regulator [Planctomycetota bacterium]
MNQENQIKPIDILLVEDDPGDARLTKEAMKDTKLRNNIFHVTDGEEAMAFLRKEGRYADVPCPDLILMDLNLPKRNGIEVLAEIKNNKNLKRIPVVILTVSSAEEDILKSYNLHANCYITKPIDLNQFMNVVKSIEDFWLTIVKLPNGSKKLRKADN